MCQKIWGKVIQRQEFFWRISKMSRIRIQHKAIYWACFYFHSFKLLRGLYFPSVWSISSSNFMYKDKNINVKKNVQNKVGLSPSKWICSICSNGSPLKMIKNAFYFTLKAPFVLRILTFLSWLFGYIEEMAWLEHKVNSKIYDVTTWFTNSYNIHIAQYLKVTR